MLLVHENGPPQLFVPSLNSLLCQGSGHEETPRFIAWVGELYVISVSHLWMTPDKIQEVRFGVDTHLFMGNHVALP